VCSHTHYKAQGPRIRTIVCPLCLRSQTPAEHQYRSSAEPVVFMPYCMRTAHARCRQGIDTARRAMSNGACHSCYGTLSDVWGDLAYTACVGHRMRLPTGDSGWGLGLRVPGALGEYLVPHSRTQDSATPHAPHTRRGWGRAGLACAVPVRTGASLRFIRGGSSEVAVGTGRGRPPH